MNRLLLAIIALGFACSTSSCSLWRRVTGRQKAPAADSARVLRDSPDSAVVQADTPVIMPPALPDSASQALLQAWLQRWNARTAYTTFAGKAKAQYESGGEEKDFTIQIQMEKDKRIWISITGSFLGLSMEAVRALITPDSIIAINRLQKEVRSLPFSEAGKLLPVNVDFSTLQSLIVGDLLPAGHAPGDAADTANTVIIRALGQDFVQAAQYDKADSSLRFQTLASAAAFLLIEYGRYEAFGARRFAHDRTMMIQDKGTVHQLKLEFSKVTFDEPVEVNFSIPGKYERK